MKILISLTAYNTPASVLQSTVAHYQDEYDDHELQFVTCANYPLPFTGSQIVTIPSIYQGPDHAWSNKSYIRARYQEFDYVIESDPDITVPLSTFENYIEHADRLPLEYIPGVLSCETKEVNGITEQYLLPQLTVMPPFKELLELNGQRYYVPYYRSSACFIADRERYRLALSKGLAVNPETARGYHIQEWARTAIYHTLTEVIPFADLVNCLVYHPTKYIHSFQRGPQEFRTVEQLLNLLPKS